MPETARIGNLEIQQDLEHERLEWKIERIAWAIIAALLLAALAGLLGPGPLSQATAGREGAPLRVKFNRLAHYQAPEDLRVHVGSGVAREGRIRVWIGREHVQSMELDYIDPEPESVEVSPERFTYTFAVSGDERNGTALLFHYEPDSFGPVSIVMGLEDGPELAFTQFVYP